MPKRKAPAAMKFEQALSELEKVVEKMESNELPLEESIKHYETGTRLSHQCQMLLDDAEQKVKTLTAARPDDLPATDEPEGNGDD